MSVDMFIKLGDIEGESVDSKKKDWIEVLAWSWGMTQSGTMHTGTGGGSGRVNVQDLTITKYVDKATPNLMQKCCDGTHYNKATLVVRKAGKDALEYVNLDMFEVIITSISQGASGGQDRVTENVTMNFAKYNLNYKPQTAEGRGAGDVRQGWDIRKNTQA